MTGCHRGPMVQPKARIRATAVVNHEELCMFRRISLLLALLSPRALSGYLFFPHVRGHGDRPDHRGGPGFDMPR